MDNELKEMLRSVIQEELAPVNDKLNRLETEQELIKQAVLDTNERVVKIETILENQHKIIELLSARSIQHEAELKRIK